jgi:hypothetical protein
MSSRISRIIIPYPKNSEVKLSLDNLDFEYKSNHSLPFLNNLSLQQNSYNQAHEQWSKTIIPKHPPVSISRQSSQPWRTKRPISLSSRLFFSEPLLERHTEDEVISLREKYQDSVDEFQEWLRMGEAERIVSSRNMLSS